MTTALAIDGPKVNGPQPLDVGRSGRDNSGERKENGECNVETKQHGEEDRKTFSGWWIVRRVYSKTDRPR